MLHAKFGMKGAGDVMFSRFCLWADLAKDEGLERVLAVDSDIALFDDVQKVFAPFQEDVVTPCSTCSQISLWNAKALDMFCDSMLAFLTLPPGQVFDLLLKYHAIRAPHEGGPPHLHFTDMDFLRIFLEENLGGHNLKWVDLTASAEPSPRIPLPGVWLPANTAFWASQDMMTPAGFLAAPDKNIYCKNFDDIFTFQPSSTSGMPLPTHKATGVTFPIIHFNNLCKLMVGKMYQTHYNKWFNATYRASTSKHH
jgi:hypothetical protein